MRRYLLEAIMVTGRSSYWLVRFLRLDPVRRLRLRRGHRLTIFPLVPAAPQATSVS